MSRNQVGEGGNLSKLKIMHRADWSYVDASEYLPSGHGADAQDERHRLRGGVHYGQNGYTAFYGVTYLWPEFATLPPKQRGRLLGRSALDGIPNHTP